MIRDMWEDAPWLLVLIGVVFFVLLPVGLWAMVREQQQWDAFAVQHHCQIFIKTTATTSTGFGMTSNGTSGMVTMTTPGKTGYRCDDGVEYWR